MTTFPGKDQGFGAPGGYKDRRWYFFAAVLGVVAALVTVLSFAISFPSGVARVFAVLVCCATTGLIWQSFRDRVSRPMVMWLAATGLAVVSLIFVLADAGTEGAEATDTSPPPTASASPGRESSTGTQPNVPTSPPVEDPTSGAEEPAQQSAPATTPPIRYEGPLAVDPDGKDLDLGPPASSDAEDGGDLSYNFIDGGLYPEGGATVAQWTDDSLPSYADCSAIAAAASVDTLELKIGDVVCVRTSEDRTARLEVTGFGDRYSYIFDAVVWEVTNT